MWPYKFLKQQPPEIKYKSGSWFDVLVSRVLGSRFRGYKDKGKRSKDKGESRKVLGLKDKGKRLKAKGSGWLSVVGVGAGGMGLGFSADGVWPGRRDRG